MYQVLDYFTLDLVMLGLLAMFAAWTQTLTGFAFGLILMGGVGISGLIPLPEAAVVVSVLTIVNGSLMLRSDWRELDRYAFGLFMAGSIPGLALGYVSLLWLAGAALGALQALLGAIIIGASLQMMRRPRTQALRSSAVAFFAAGFAGGIMGGLFSTAGPPVIWQMYRQPTSLAAVRVTLVAVFASNAVVRLLLVMASTGFPVHAVSAALISFPLVMLGTLIARAYPPPLSPNVMRQLAFSLLLLSGLAMLLPKVALIWSL